MSIKGVCCAIDVNDFDQDVIDLAALFAKQFGAELDLIHVTLYPDPTNAAWPAYVGSPVTIIQDNRRLRTINSGVPAVKLHYHHLSGIPTEKILSFVEKNESLLLVVGTHARRGLSRLLGSVATKLMRRATCPVLVLRQRQNDQDFADLKRETTQETTS